MTTIENKYRGIGIAIIIVAIIFMIKMFVENPCFDCRMRIGLYFSPILLVGVVLATR